MTTTTKLDHYDAFRRANGLWAEGGKFFSGVYADSPSACGLTDETPAFVGWIAGTEYADDELFWETTELTDAESIAFMESPGFVLYGEADGETAAAAAGYPGTLL